MPQHHSPADKDHLESEPQAVRPTSLLRREVPLSWLLLVICLGFGIALALALKAFLTPQLTTAKHRLTGSIPQADPAIQMDSPAEFAGVSAPMFLTAGEAEIEDDEPVIAITVNEQHRAYRLQALASMGDHIVNDVFEGVSVSVAYCDQTNCVRVFAREGSGQRLNIATQGWVSGQMWIKVDGKGYALDDPKIPLQQLAFARVAWRKWKKDHPESKVYADSALP